MVEAKPCLVGYERNSTVTDTTLKMESPDIYLDDHVMDLKYSPT
jgi:hypothetical protein